MLFRVVSYSVLAVVLVTGDPDHHAAGVTNAAGRFEVDDDTYIPAFFDAEPAPQTSTVTWDPE